ncbi:hypothetical protein Dsin_008019 [Dipteronia sinensis]|uniref:Uncharacterized protein n=1 Tax=Dipteronia sinensis TaxID=43782 RepID=A0AAE0EHN1_9ROSI|nr:hypothetical protein Dsin_008019 [Dipteronia sinensis]
MCRTTDFQGFKFNRVAQDRLKIKSFSIRLSNLQHGSCNKKLPESLTLVYLPRINETALEVSGKNIRPDSPAFVTLYRVITAKTEEGESVYGSREKVMASDGVMFEVYSRDDKILKGVFRKDDDDEWKLECKCTLERDMKKSTVGDVARAEVCVGAEGHVAMVDTVDLVVKKRRNRNGRVFGNGLEEIPEQREVVDTESEISNGCCCSCGNMEKGLDGEDSTELDMEMDGVRWAVDVGFWVMCFGVGYLVSKASAKSLRRIRIF